MSSGPARRVSRQDIQLVQNLIERCLQLYMNQKEVVETLLGQAKIEPGFTELVWQKLEEENQEFFRAYYLRLMVKHQIIEFNKLLEQQWQLMQQMHQPGVSPLPTSNGSHMQPLNHKQVCYAADQAGQALKAENTQQILSTNMADAFSNNGGALLNTNMRTAVNMSSQTRGNDALPSMISSQVANMSLMQGMNGGVKTEVAYTGNAPYMFGGDANVLEARPAVGDASVASFNNVESNSQPLSDPLVDADASSFGYLGQIPRNFSLSDLTADFSQSSDILESYSRSPFLASDTDNFLDSHEREQYQGDNRRLETISESLSYEDFGSESR